MTLNSAPTGHLFAKNPMIGCRGRSSVLLPIAKKPSHIRTRAHAPAHVQRRTYALPPYPRRERTPIRDCRRTPIPDLSLVLNSSLNLFPVKQQKPDAFIHSEAIFCNCCLTILIYTFKLFKGATNPSHTYIFGFKGIGLWG